MKSIVVKLTPEQAKTYQGVILAPAMGDLDDIDPGEYAVTLSGTEKAIRTIKQNSALHKYLSLLSDAFNEAGLGMEVVLKKLFKHPNFRWTQEAVKERLWVDVQEAMIGHRKTSKLEPKQVSEVYEALNAATATSLGVSVEFPSNDSMMNKSLGRR